MASYAGLLELRGPWGHTVLDLPSGVLEAATQTVPPVALRPFLATLLNKCSNNARTFRTVTMTDVLFSTALFECPDISKAHLVAFDRWLWPRHETLAQLEQYQGVFGRSSGLKGMEPELRQLVEAVFAQESEWVLVAVLQHLIDGYCTRLISAPRCIESVLTGEAPSMTIPEDPRLHQLLRQLHAELVAELQRQGKVVRVRELPPAAPPASASQLQGFNRSSEDDSPGTPGLDGSDDKASAAASSAATCRSPRGSESVAAPGSAADGRGSTADGPECGLRRRRHCRAARQRCAALPG